MIKKPSVTAALRRVLAALVCAAALLGGAAPALAEDGTIPITLSELERGAFPARGTARHAAEALAAPGGDAAAQLAAGEAVDVVDYLLADGGRYFAIGREGGVLYVEEASLDVAFAAPVPGWLLRDAHALADGTAAEDGPEENLLPAGLGLWVTGQQDGAWVLDTYEGAWYIALDALSPLPSRVTRYAEAGVYGGEALALVEGTVAVSAADVTLRNMIITGALYLLEGIDGGTVALEDVYALGGMFPKGDMTLSNDTARMTAAIGNPAEVIGSLFEAYYRSGDEEALTRAVEDIAQAMADALTID